MRNRYHLWEVNNRNFFIIINLHDIGIDENIIHKDNKNTIGSNIVYYITELSAGKQHLKIIQKDGSGSCVFFFEELLFHNILSMQVLVLSSMNGQGFKTSKSTQTGKGKGKTKIP